jgi:hypothetical protein
MYLLYPVAVPGKYKLRVDQSIMFHTNQQNYFQT